MSSQLIVSSAMVTRPSGTPTATTKAADATTNTTTDATTNTITNTQTTPTTTLNPTSPAYSPSSHTFTPLHHLPRSLRLSFLSSPLIPIYIGATLIRTIPSALLTAVAKPSRLRPFLRANAIHLAPDTDPHGVTTLLQHLWVLTTELPTPSPLTQNEDLYTALAVTQASYRLDMSGVTRQVFRDVEEYLAFEVPSYEQMDAVMWFRGSHPRLWRVMVSTLGRWVREEGWEGDGGAFWEFCQHKPVLCEAVLERVREVEMEELEAAGAQQDGGDEQAPHTASEQLALELGMEELSAREAGGGGEGARQSPRTAQEQQAFEMEKYERRERGAGEKQGKRGTKEKKQDKREAEVRRSALAKAKANGKKGFMTTEERECYVKYYGEPPKGC